MKRFWREVEEPRGVMIEFTVLFGNPDEDQVVRIPARYEVCGYCHGSGRSSAYLGSWTGEEWAQEDPQFQDDYLAGRYDRDCPECGGKRVVAVPLEPGLMSEEERKWLDHYWEQIKEEEDYQALCRAEMRACYGSDW